MIIENRLLEGLLDGIKNPTLLGRVIQICTRDQPLDLSLRSLVEMDADDPAIIGQIEATEISPAFRVLVAFTEDTALSIALAAEEIGLGRGSDIEKVSQFRHGFFLGFLQGLGESEGYSEVTCRELGSLFVQILRYDRCSVSKGINFSGEISNAVSEVWSSCFPFVDQFMADARRQPAWVSGFFGQRLVDGFLHKAVSAQISVASKLALWPALSKTETAPVEG